jgi:hypothetical protein
MIKDEKEHLSAVAGIGCIICRRMGYIGTPAEIHHIRAGTGKGQKASNYDTLPLCPEHHRGKTGIHGLGTKGFVKHYGITEVELLAEVAALVQEDKDRSSLFTK